MAITEVHGGRVTCRSLANRTEDELASRVPVLPHALDRERDFREAAGRRPATATAWADRAVADREEALTEGEKELAAERARVAKAKARLSDQNLIEGQRDGLHLQAGLSGADEFRVRRSRHRDGFARVRTRQAGAARRFRA